MNDEQQEYYAFEHRDSDGKITYTRVTGNDRWPDVLEDFVRFLEGIYKYNIKDHIRLEKPCWVDLDTDNEIYDPWSNHYFEIDIEEEETNEDSSDPGLSG